MEARKQDLCQYSPNDLGLLRLEGSGLVNKFESLDCGVRKDPYTVLVVIACGCTAENA